MNSNPGATFTAVLEGAPSNLEGTIGVRLLDASNDAVVIARTTSGIAEAIAGSGVYEIQLTAPTTEGEYIIVWDDGGNDPADFASEPLTVGGAYVSEPITIQSGSSTLRLPQANAVVVNVALTSAVEDWDRTETTVLTWTGRADAYVSSIKARTTDQTTNSSDQTSERALLLPRAIPVELGARIYYHTRDGNDEVLTIKTIDYKTPPPGVEGPIRITGELV